MASEERTEELMSRVLISLLEERQKSSVQQMEFFMRLENERSRWAIEQEQRQMEFLLQLERHRESSTARVVAAVEASTSV